ncbi:MAG: hypothetical protein JST49_01415 [Bacteroidetes bacterium]|nr:hypothetical protein [Bacteroidota bacterium]
MKIYALVCLCFVGFILSAQDSDVVFTVKTKPTINPNIDTLVGGRVYHFKVNGLALTKIVAATINNGRVVVTASEITIWPNSTERQLRIDTLNLYVNVDGKYQKALSKAFTVITVPVAKGNLVYTNTNTQQLYFDTGQIESISTSQPDSISLDRYKSRKVSGPRAKERRTSNGLVTTNRRL